jgi:hypothetical protein
MWFAKPQHTKRSIAPTVQQTGKLPPAQVHLRTCVCMCVCGNVCASACVFVLYASLCIQEGVQRRVGLRHFGDYITLTGIARWPEERAHVSRHMPSVCPSNMQSCLRLARSFRIL